MEWERIEKWQFIVDSVAYEYHKKFNMVETADIRQSLYQWFAEHPVKLQQWESIGHKDAKNLLYRSLRNQALDYCQRWKAKTLGYDTSDLHYYSLDIVAFLLPSVLRGELNKAPKIDLGMPSKPSAPSEGGNAMAMMIEIDYAYWKLNKDDRKVLFLKYAMDSTDAEIGEQYQLSEDAVRMKVNRILKKLVHKIGGFKPFHDLDSDSETQESLSESV